MVSLSYLIDVKWIPDKIRDFHLSGLEQNCQPDLVPKNHRIRSNTGLLATLLLLDASLYIF